MSSRLFKTFFSSGIQVIAIQFLGGVFFYIISLYLSKSEFGLISWSNGICLTITLLLGFGVGFLVLVGIAALDGRLYFERGAIGVSLAAFILFLGCEIAKFPPQPHVLIIDFLQLLPEVPKVLRMNLALSAVQLLHQLGFLQLGLMNLPHDVVVRLLPRALLLRDAQLIATHRKLAKTVFLFVLANSAVVE